MYFDPLSLHTVEVGSSPLGMDGSLGYEGKSVMVRGHPYHHALSTFPLVHLMFQLDGCFRHFSCQVALNDDVPADLSQADFNVLASGRQVLAFSHLVAGECRTHLTLTAWEIDESLRPPGFLGEPGRDKSPRQQLIRRLRKHWKNVELKEPNHVAYREGRHCHGWKPWHW